MPAIRARICPENGARIFVKETAIGRDEITPIHTDPTSFAEGLLVIAYATGQLLEIEDGVAEIPEGATVRILDANGVDMAQLEIHRNGTKPMLNIIGDTHPCSDDPLYHHVDEGYFNATRLPDELNSWVAIWSHTLSPQV